MDYQIIFGENSANLEYIVNEKISEGWQPIGGIAFLSSANHDIAQAMIRYDEDEELPAVIDTTTEEPSRIVTVTADKANLRYIKKYNLAGNPKFVIYGSIVSKRYQFVRGAQLKVAERATYGNGGNNAYLVFKDQVDSFGKRLPDDLDLYVMRADVE